MAGAAAVWSKTASGLLENEGAPSVRAYSSSLCCVLLYTEQEAPHDARFSLVVLRLTLIMFLPSNYKLIIIEVIYLYFLFLPLPSAPSESNGASN